MTQDAVIQDQLKITKVVRMHMAECARFRELVEDALEDKADGPSSPTGQQHEDANTRRTNPNVYTE